MSCHHNGWFTAGPQAPRLPEIPADMQKSAQVDLAFAYSTELSKASDCLWHERRVTVFKWHETSHVRSFPNLKQFCICSLPFLSVIYTSVSSTFSLTMYLSSFSSLSACFYSFFSFRRSQFILLFLFFFLPYLFISSYFLLPVSFFLPFSTSLYIRSLAFLDFYIFIFHLIKLSVAQTIHCSFES